MATYYIGWDVGAWKCGAGLKESCDALVIMDKTNIIGFHRRNLGPTIRGLLKSPCKQRSKFLINHWFKLCKVGCNDRATQHDNHYVIAIDTPLGWPIAFKNLLNEGSPTIDNYDPNQPNIENPLLYRYTEREMLRGGMSVVVDSIGSQSVKGILLRQLLGAKGEGWGKWTVGNMTLLETYPKACLVRRSFVNWMTGLKLTTSLAEEFPVRVSDPQEQPRRYRRKTVIAEDVFDAAVCACVAKAFCEGQPALVTPPQEDPRMYESEGWIFYPKNGDETVNPKAADGHRNVTSCEGIETFAKALAEFSKHVGFKSAVAGGAEER
jgi:hypothetical protein